MKKLGLSVLVCVLMLIIATTLIACSNEAEILQERVDTLEAENTELQSTISSLRSDLERSQSDLTNSQSELIHLRAAIAAAEEAEQQAASGQHSGPLAVTYGGQPNTDMTWPYSYGDLPLGLRIDFNEVDEDLEIYWESGNVNVFTVVSSIDGTSATVIPVHTGSAQVIVTVGDLETRSWIRIT